MKRQKTQSKTVQPSHTFEIEAEVVPGLEQVARDEIARVLHGSVRMLPDTMQRSGAVRFSYEGKLAKLRQLRTVQTVYLVQRFEIPRPKAFLGNEQYRTLLTVISKAMSVDTASSYATFYIGAAGSDSAVFRRLAAQLAASTGLREDREQGDLWIRFRRAPNAEGWEVLVRLGNRPLATRDWRVCNYQGALNATVAQAMVVLSRSIASDHVLNLGSGSASIMIERGLSGPAASIVGVDHSVEALHCAQQNMRVARTSAPLVQADMRNLPFADDAFDVLLADLPFGQLSGSHAENINLYPAALDEAGRIAKHNARFVVITHEVRLFEDVVGAQALWSVDSVQRVTLRGLHPRIYCLLRR